MNFARLTWLAAVAALAGCGGGGGGDGGGADSGKQVPVAAPAAPQQGSQSAGQPQALELQCIGYRCRLPEGAAQSAEGSLFRYRNSSNTAQRIDIDIDGLGYG
ncbi:hypothetical protein, partial [Chromobacterium amazonense]|uniref:hypothetical protein n=1 Tax=Chromobacterium amazonense TaxID=1382803 RepID=UPI003F7B068C